MAKAIQPYPTVWDFFSAHGLPAYRGDWRLTEYQTGEIKGIPTSRGWLTATNGIECFIKRDDGSLFRGHLDWFMADKEPSTSRQAGQRISPKMSELFDINF